MKIRVGISIGLIVLALSFAFYCILRLNRATDELRQATEAALLAATEQSPDWLAATDEVARLWERERGFMHILFPHMNINELEWSIGAMQHYQRLGDHALFIESSVRALQCLNTVREMERPTLGNIF